jgi:CRP-like cAMP-binding protein
MNTFVTPRAEHALFQRETLSYTDLQSLWRLESGALRLDSQAADGGSDFVRLALPGDLLGVESLAGVTDHLTVRAITPARLRPVDLVDTTHLTQLLMETISKVHQRCCEMASLRTGSTTVRIQRLLQMLSSGSTSASHASEPTRCALPTLSDMATIVNAAPETVCRVLASLRELDFLQERSPKSAKHHRLEVRDHRVKPGMPARTPALRTRMANP